MAEHKKKVIVSVAAAALCAVMLLFFLCRSNLAGAAGPPAGNTSPSAANIPNFYATKSDNLSSRELFYKMMASVILIVILGGAAMYVSKKFLPKITSRADKNIRILETVHFGPRKTVYLLKAGEKKLLIGSAGDSIAMLADVTEALTNKTAES